MSIILDVVTVIPRKLLMLVTLLGNGNYMIASTFAGLGATMTGYEVTQKQS